MEKNLLCRIRDMEDILGRHSLILGVVIFNRRHLFSRSLFNLLAEIYPVRRHHFQSTCISVIHSATVGAESNQNCIVTLTKHFYSMTNRLCFVLGHIGTASPTPHVSSGVKTIWVQTLQFLFKKRWHPKDSHECHSG